MQQALHRASTKSLSQHLGAVAFCTHALAWEARRRARHVYSRYRVAGLGCIPHKTHYLHLLLLAASAAAPPSANPPNPLARRIAVVQVLDLATSGPGLMESCRDLMQLRVAVSLVLERRNAAVGGGAAPWRPTAEIH